MADDIEMRLGRVERITKLLALLEIIKTKRVRNDIKNDLNKEMLAYLKGGR